MGILDLRMEMLCEVRGMADSMGATEACFWNQGSGKEHGTRAGYASQPLIR
jgi:hypothetical protein